MYTHFRGAHGKGYRATCGELYQWPAARAQHQGGCTPCKNHLELRKLKKKFPMPFKKEDSGHTVKQEKQERNEWTILHYVFFACANMWNSSHIYFIVRQLRLSTSWSTVFIIFIVTKVFMSWSIVFKATKYLKATKVVNCSWSIVFIVSIATKVFMSWRIVFIATKVFMSWRIVFIATKVFISWSIVFKATKYIKATELFISWSIVFKATKFLKATKVLNCSWSIVFKARILKQLRF